MTQRRLQAPKFIQSIPLFALSLAFACINACSSGDDSSSGPGAGASAGGASGVGANGGLAGVAGGTAGGAPNGGVSGVGGVGGAAAGGVAGSGTAGGAGVSGTAGGAGTGGVGGTTGVAGAPDEGGAAGESGSSVASTATRPQLTSAQAANDTILTYLAQAGSLVTPPAPDNWDPTAGVGDVTTFTPAYTVGSAATYTTVQSAITAAVTAGGTARVYIQVMPGTYPEQVCVPSGAPPITLYSTTADATQTVIVAGHYSGEAKAAGVSANPCNPNTSGTTYGTSGSATFAAFANGFQAKNLTFSNDLDEGTMTSGVQAVALETQGDQLVFENVRALGNQDTLYVKSGSVDTVARAYFKSSYVEGDVDFIFGRGTMVFDTCTLQYLSTRRGASNGGNLVAPSTDYRNPYGILIIDSNLTADAGTAAGTVALGRAWDEGSAALPADLTMTNPFLTAVAGVPTTTYTNGQALVRNSVLGAHIQAAPWDPAASSNRPYSSTDVVVAAGTYPANRLYEFENTGPGNGG